MIRFLYWVEAECIFVGRIAAGGKSFWAAQAALVVGLGFVVTRVDFIPDRMPVIGHLDGLVFLLAGFMAAHKLVPAEGKLRSRRNIPRSAYAPGIRTAALPTFFIVGAPRCGTTSLFDAIGRHPDVFCCPVKEPNHFATDRNAKPKVLASAIRRGALLKPGSAGLDVLPRVATTPDFETYLSLFNGWSGERAIGEASTSYLLSTAAATEIARRRPDARIIMVLRHPVQRAQSEYLMHAQLGRKMGKFEEGHAVLGTSDDEDAVDSSTIIETSLYAPQIKRYLNTFARNQLLFLRFEDILENEQEVLRRVFQHIGVDPDAADKISLSHHNQSRSVRFPLLNRLLFRTGLRDVILHGLPAPLRRRLARRYYSTGSQRAPHLSIDLFRADIAETQRLTGLDLSHWISEK
jgi:uncharacterized membrane protein YkvA (DUF1232 family)